MGLIPHEFDLARQTTEEFDALIAADSLIVVLLPVGAVEPHGPHLELRTDVTISEVASVRAAALLKERGYVPLIAPSVPYGVTICAAAFKGAVSVSEDALTNYLSAVVRGLLDNGVDHVCLVNNHLEPQHDRAVRRSIEPFATCLASVACPLTRRWARTLSSEFRSGACHAGEYETAIMMAGAPESVREIQRSKLPAVPVSLSDKLHSGVTDFQEMGLDRAYAGSPATATADHGNEQLDRLAEMIATEVIEAMV